MKLLREFLLEHIKLYDWLALSDENRDGYVFNHRVGDAAEASKMIEAQYGVWNVPITRHSPTHFTIGVEHIGMGKLANSLQSNNFSYSWYTKVTNNLQDPAHFITTDSHLHITAVPGSIPSK